jgi:predicted GNAT family acetyltransferase
VADDDPEVPGIVGMVPHIETAARGLASATGRRPERMLAQGVYALREVREVPRASGSARIADERHRKLLRGWLTDFTTEALPEHARDRELGRIERTIDLRLQAGEAGFWIWEDEGTPVSLSGFGGPTPSGIRIGPVYTPTERRRRGYATTLVADQSRWALDHGHRACFLYTDLANPTSNRIYEEIGYERVGDSADYRFVEP